MPFVMCWMPLRVMDGGRLDVFGVLVTNRCFTAGTESVTDNNAENNTGTKTSYSIQSNVREDLK